MELQIWKTSLSHIMLSKSQFILLMGLKKCISVLLTHVNTAETVSILLNDAYDGAYQDGLNASVKEKYKELIDKIISLSIQNSRLKNLLNLDEVK